MTRIILTDTSGNPLPRFARSAVRRVLKSPVNVTAGGQACYAAVWCESKTVGIMRDGRGPRTCRYSVCQGASVVAEFQGCQREEAIAEFFGLLRGKPVDPKPASAAPAGMLF